VERGLFAIFVKIRVRVHRGKSLNEKANRWVDEGCDDEDSIRLDRSNLRPIFSWMERSIKHRDPRDLCRDLLDCFGKQKSVHDKSKRHLRQSIEYYV